MAIVCDGHGGDDYMRSAVGSMCACNATERNIKYFLENISKKQFLTDPEKHLKELEASIINVWNQLIYAHYEQHPFSDTELRGVSEKARKRYTQEKQIESAYGTTLIAVAMTQEYWFGIHIGDGKCVAINPEGKFVQPIPWDQKCFLNATTSICDSDALNSFRHFYSEKLPVAVFVGSDGVDDCFNNNEQLHNLYKTILYSFGTSGFEEALDGLEDYLPRLSAKGSGDDVSIAAILDLDLVPELDIVKEFDREKEKARVEANARKDAEKNEAERIKVEEKNTKLQQEKNVSAIVEKHQKFCFKCGAKLSSDNKFCGECGARVEEIDMPFTITDLDTDEMIVVRDENIISEQLSNNSKLGGNDINDGFMIEENKKTQQIIDEQVNNIVEDSEKEIVDNLAEYVIQETMKTDI